MRGRVAGRTRRNTRPVRHLMGNRNRALWIGTEEGVRRNGSCSSFAVKFLQQPYAHVEE